MHSIGKLAEMKTKCRQVYVVGCIYRCGADWPMGRGRREGGVEGCMMGRGEKMGELAERWRRIWERRRRKRVEGGGGEWGKGERRTDRQTDRQTEKRADRQTESDIRLTKRAVHLSLLTL